MSLYLIVRWIVKQFFKIVYRHKTYGLEHVYDDAAIVAANHTSFYDPPIVSTSWPIEVHFLARDTLFKNPAFGWLIRALHSHPVKGTGGDIAVFKEVGKLLKEGKQILLFPEGSRSFDGELATLKEGVALIAYRNQVPIIPVYIHGAYEIFGRTRKFPKFSGRTACVFGSPISFEEFSNMDKHECYRAITERLTQAILGLKDWFDKGAKGVPP